MSMLAYGFSEESLRISYGKSNTRNMHVPTNYIMVRESIMGLWIINSVIMMIIMPAEIISTLVVGGVLMIFAILLIY